MAVSVNICGAAPHRIVSCPFFVLFWLVLFVSFFFFLVLVLFCLLFSSVCLLVLFIWLRVRWVYSYGRFVGLIGCYQAPGTVVVSFFVVYFLVCLFVYLPCLVIAFGYVGLSYFVIIFGCHGRLSCLFIMFIYHACSSCAVIVLAHHVCLVVYRVPSISCFLWARFFFFFFFFFSAVRARCACQPTGRWGGSEATLRLRRDSSRSPRWR